MDRNKNEIHTAYSQHPMLQGNLRIGQYSVPMCSDKRVSSVHVLMLCISILMLSKNLTNLCYVKKSYVIIQIAITDSYFKFIELILWKVRKRWQTEHLTNYDAVSNNIGMKCNTIIAI